MQYKEVQNIAKTTIEFIKDNIQPNMTLLEIRNMCETKMMELGADSFWYWDVGAFVFSGEETTLSVSGKEIDICAFQDGTAPMNMMSDYFNRTKEFCRKYSVEIVYNSAGGGAGGLASADWSVCVPDCMLRVSLL